MPRKLALAVIVGLVVFASMPARGQINFPKRLFYVAMGDSFAAGTGALPVTNGYAYELYARGVFGQIQETKFANMALPGARSWDFRDHQVPQLLCSGDHGVTERVVTVTVGAIDFFRGDLNFPAIAWREADGINLLFNNDSSLVPNPVLDPFTGEPCPALSNVTILVSLYPAIPHPDPAVAAQLDQVQRAADQWLRYYLSLIQVPTGSRLAFVDVFTPSLGRTGLVLGERRLGLSGSGTASGALGFDPHPTNLGHRFMAQEFERVWNQLQ